MGIKIEKKQVKASVTVEKKRKKDVVGSKTTEVAVAEVLLPSKDKMLPEQVANVGCSMAYTKNMGNYEAVKVTVSLFYPCATDPKSLDAGFKFVQGWVDKKLTGVMEEIVSEAEA